MPTYEYRCNKCEDTFDAFQSITADPLKLCPSCGGDVVRIISGGAGLLFKGDGFYITDYRSEGYKKDAKKDKPASETKSKSDSKATKPDSKGKTSDSGSKSKNPKSK